MAAGGADELAEGFNRNMGCIEIIDGNILNNCVDSLIETWDVLKSFPTNCCGGVNLFNRNMGCIEMIFPDLLKKHCLSLIETWDVLKLVSFCDIVAVRQSLIETWDVLKLEKTQELAMEESFNRNMGCIEIKITGKGGIQG